MTLMIPNIVADDEHVARCCFSSKKKNHRLFVVGEAQNNKISTDRSSLAGEATTLQLAVNRFKKRLELGTARRFYGWRILLTSDAASGRRQVVADPVDDNPYHANIVLPERNPKLPPDVDPYVFHAQALADVSEWKPAPPYEHML